MIRSPTNPLDWFKGNAQMLLSAFRFLPQHSSPKGKEPQRPSIPSIDDLQVIIENAWREGLFLQCPLTARDLSDGGLQASTNRGQNISVINSRGDTSGSGRQRCVLRRRLLDFIRIDLCLLCVYLGLWIDLLGTHVPFLSSSSY
jgi:hypothetical protein